ncbi:hypothetical protein EHQ12_12610 [Leptospira gomenensis]|uniref:ATP-grasp domain-containing protein n=1 Tax=Leptospira gomenensis TaxID=2484974 RepID=A0A5F1Y9J0_9LEPT|nr:hypothetical protein [Leptospira gomenensis]TGK32771.1 hypothetical protein EHQ17_12455 [Leptospira gomenensis]TGK36919.1 hypothetical protein EHQ12_12610 [Leptospira gomenensis]TGK44390.1 hypothetical protein EHQ07_11925 [Leptospira gomenensis]TGK58883.1 hypothetical protein EHQ13_13745 [Leptospira gomenensis]
MILQTKNFSNIMTRYCRFNGYFEEELKTGRIAPEKLDLKNRTLEPLFYLFQSVRFPKTVMFLGEEPDPDWVRYWNETGIRLADVSLFRRDSENKIKIPSYDAQPFSETIWEEWGAVSEITDSGEVKVSPNVLERSRKLNSKIRSTLWKDARGFQEIPTRILERPSDLAVLYGEWSELRIESIVLKPEFGFSGRHKLLPLRWLDKSGVSEFAKNPSLASFFPCVAEPWLIRTSDVSCLYEFSSGVPTTLGSTIQLCDDQGKYLGAVLTTPRESERISTELESIATSLSQTFAAEYSGPVSIDGFEFCSQNSTEWRRMSEANFRWSMGRMLLEFMRSDSIREKTKFTGKRTSLLSLPVRRPIPNYSKWISTWGKSIGIHLLPLTPDRFLSGKSYGTSWILAEFPKNETDSIAEVIRRFRSEWRKRIL